MRGNALARTSVAVAVTAALGGVAVDPRSRWYRRLTKPRWQPPASVFGIVWTVLYADLAVTSATALSEATTPRERADYWRGLVVNLALNAGWNWLFWRVRKPWPATVEAAALTISSADLVRRTARSHRGAGAALVPYAAWCAFATVLTAAIARRN